MSAYSAAALQHLLTTREIGRKIDFRDVCTSTNDVALDLMTRGAVHGTLVVADAQTEGRGQRGRTWHSPPGSSIYASLVLRADVPRVAPTLLVAAVGLGLAEGLEAATGATIGIKWPNDLWYGGKKIAGILVEAKVYRNVSPGFVAGFGVNASQSETDFPPELRATATSLRIVTGRRHDRAAVLATALAALEHRVDDVLLGRSAADLHDAYRRRSVLVGQRVSLLDADTAVEGWVTDLSATDGLIVRTSDGRHRHVLAEHARDVRPVE